VPTDIQDEYAYMFVVEGNNVEGVSCQFIAGNIAPSAA
jgi:hypothetical protein